MIWLFLGLAFVAWSLWEAAAQGSPYRSEGVEVSLRFAPKRHLVMPVLCWGVGLGLDSVIDPWGSRSVAALHGVQVVCAWLALSSQKVRRRVRDAA